MFLYIEHELYRCSPSMRYHGVLHISRLDTNTTAQYWRARSLYRHPVSRHRSSMPPSSLSSPRDTSYFPHIQTFVHSILF